MQQRQTRHLVSLALSLAALLPGAAGAQSAGDWPARPVTIIVPLAPGATVDIETRLYANELAKNMGKTFLVDAVLATGTTIGPLQNEISGTPGIRRFMQFSKHQLSQHQIHL